MVGIIDDTFIRYPVGSRIRIGENCGTVKYVGEVCGYSGTWLGVEWDDPHRGKHDGSIDGKHYFLTEYPKAGSFIRPGKIGPMKSLEEAARNRYLGYTSNSLDQELIREVQQSSQASLFEVVGMDKIARKQSKFEQLADISVEGCDINAAGCLKDFRILTTLNISHTLIWNWQIVADILKQVPTLLDLNLSCNRLQLPSNIEITELEQSFKNLQHLNLRNCGFSKWSDIVQTARLFPNIVSLGLQENPISELNEVDSKSIFKNIRELDLHRTKINDFKEVCKLGGINTLVSLNLMENNIEEIKLPDCEPHEKLDIFLSLEQINLDLNPILNEAAAFNELDKLPKLKRLSKTPHLKSNFEEMFSKAVGIISNLETLNKLKITKEEKRGAEYDIWKSNAVEWLQASLKPETLHEFYKKNRSYAKAIKKHGSPIDFMPLTNVKQSKLIKVHVRNFHTGETWDKKVPRMITVQTMQGLIVKQFHLEQLTMPKLSYVDAKHPDLVVPMDNTSKTLDYYSLQENDTILVQW